MTFLRLSQDSTAFVNANHKTLLEISDGLTCRYYGSAEHAPSSRFIEGGERRFVWAEGGEESEALPVQLEGDYNLDNITTAIAGITLQRE